MNLKSIFLSTIISVAFCCGLAATASAQAPRLYATNGQLRTLINRIETRTNAFQYEVQRSFSNNNNVSENREDQIEELISEFENATDTLKVQTNSRQTLTGEVNEVFNRAARINTFVSSNRLSARATSQWSSIRTDLNTLATYYRISWNWNQNQMPPSVIGQSPRLYATASQLQQLLNRIETRTDAFKSEVQRNFDNNNNNISENREDRIEDLISEFENATDTLKVQVNSRQTLTGEVNEVFNRAGRINTVVSNNRFSQRATSQWSAIRTDLNTLATYYRISWNWNQNQMPPSVIGQSPRLYATAWQLQQLLNRIETRTDAFKSEVQRNFDNNNNNISENREDRIEDLISEFENATDTLKVQTNSRQTLTGEVNEVFNRAGRINTFVSNSRLSQRATSQWSAIRTDLNTLATYYRISWNWNQMPPTGGGFNNGNASIDGTYRLNVNRSDNVANVIEASLRNSTASQRDNARQSLERRLASPEMIAIDAQGTNVTLATSNSARVTFQANGVATSETNPRGRSMTMTAILRNRALQINYTGDRTNDFSVTFTPVGRDQLSVTKRIYLEGRNEMVTVNSIYDRTSQTADWPAVGAQENWNDNTAANEFYVPNGTRITANLRGTVDTKASQVGDRFNLVVTSPSQYRDAVIEGRIVEAGNSGRVSGRASLSMAFDTIRMNGRTYQFAGIIDAVRAANGDSISVNNEGVIRDRSQTTQTATRAGIGAILGGIIGAIVGGGSGAAIGAGVGAGAGAGTVLIGGRDSIELSEGTTFDITASSPSNIRAIR